jgi:transposase
MAFVHSTCSASVIRDASMVFSVAEDVIYRWAQRWNEERSVEDRDRSGRPPALGEK